MFIKLKTMAMRFASEGLLLFFLALILRLSLIFTAHFATDEVLSFQMALGIFKGEIFPVLGQPLTAGQAKLPGALFYYFMSLSQWFSQSPEAANAMIALVGALQVSLLWKIFTYFFSRRASFLAGLFLVFSPWTVFFSDRIWNPNVMGLFSLLSLLLLVHCLKKWNFFFFALGLALASVLPQFHMSAPIFWAALLPFVWKLRRHIKFSHILLTLFFVLLFNAPYIYHELTTSFSNTKLILGESVKSHHSFRALIVTPFYLLRFLTLDVSYFELAGYWKSSNELTVLKSWFLGTDLRPFNGLRQIFLLLSFAFAGLLSFQILKKWKNEKFHTGLWGQVFLFGMCAHILLTIYSGKKIYAHYIFLLYPFIFMALPYYFDNFIKDLRSWRWHSFFIAIFIVGSLDAIYMINTRLNGLNGLSLQRHVLEKILPLEKGNTEICLYAEFPLFPESYQCLARLMTGEKINFIKGNSANNCYELSKKAPLNYSWHEGQLYLLRNGIGL